MARTIFTAMMVLASCGHGHGHGHAGHRNTITLRGPVPMCEAAECAEPGPLYPYGVYLVGMDGWTCNATGPMRTVCVRRGN